MKRLALALCLLLAFGQAEAGRFVRGTRAISYAELPGPAGSASVTPLWRNATKSADGSALGTIARTCAIYGTVQFGAKPYMKCVTGTGTTVTITGIAAGTLYFQLFHVDSAGNESERSGEFSKVAS